MRCRTLAMRAWPAVVMVPVVFLGFLPLSNSAAAQQPQRFENLQYFPKDIPRDTLLARMRGFTTALGVRCEFCHAERDQGAGVAMEGRGAGGGRGPQLNFASDAKVTKRKARYMLRMADSINTVLLPALPERSEPPVSVRCVTCHRGLAQPATLQSVLLEADAKYGLDSAAAEYRRLRATTMERGMFDFSEGSLSDVARQLADQGRVPDAIGLFQVNQEFHPNSAAIDLAMAELYRRSGDKDNAITRYRMALQKDSTNQQAKRRLTELGAGSP